MRKQIVLIMPLMLLLGACGAMIKPGKPFQASEYPFFDDGVDVVSASENLQGQFGFEVREDMDARCNLADVIGVVTILSVHSSTDVEGLEEVRIEVEVTNLLYGELAERQIYLISKSDALGHTLLKRYRSELSGQKLLFMRTFEVDNPEDVDHVQSIGHHFHLSPESPDNLKTVKALLEKRSGAESRSGKKNAEANP